MTLTTALPLQHQTAYGLLMRTDDPTPTVHLSIRMFRLYTSQRSPSAPTPTAAAMPISRPQRPNAPPTCMYARVTSVQASQVCIKFAVQGISVRWSVDHNLLIRVERCRLVPYGGPRGRHDNSCHHPSPVSSLAVSIPCSPAHRCQEHTVTACHIMTSIFQSVNTQSTQLCPHRYRRQGHRCRHVADSDAHSRCISASDSVRRRRHNYDHASRPTLQQYHPPCPLEDPSMSTSLTHDFFYLKVMWVAMPGCHTASDRDPYDPLFNLPAATPEILQWKRSHRLIGTPPRLHARMHGSVKLRPRRSPKQTFSGRTAPADYVTVHFCVTAWCQQTCSQYGQWPTLREECARSR